MKMKAQMIRLGKEEMKYSIVIRDRCLQAVSAKDRGAAGADRSTCRSQSPNPLTLTESRMTFGITLLCKKQVDDCEECAVSSRNTVKVQSCLGTKGNPGMGTSDRSNRI